jgi:hypothetical protein
MSDKHGQEKVTDRAMPNRLLIASSHFPIQMDLKWRHNDRKATYIVMGEGQAHVMGDLHKWK